MATLSDANFTGLRTSLGEWLHRSDLTDTDLGNFIFLFEKEFNREMRVRNMEAETTIASVSGALPNPSDWQEWKNITFVQNGDNYQLSAVSEEEANMLYGTKTPGTPQAYVVRGSNTVIAPAPDSSSYSYKTRYFQGVPALSGSATTNWLLNAFPDCYLHGAMAQASAFTYEDQRALGWKAIKEETFDKIKKMAKRQSFSGGVPVMRADNVI